MQPIVFGNSARPLLGVLHPAMGKASEVGVVLLQPGVHEYERAHWAFRSLASALAARGHNVLRFDYRGTGDSAGEADVATVEGCVEDVRLAWHELREVPGVRRVSLVGMRLGAAIAAIASAARSPDPLAVDDLVLWEPVVLGPRYLAELESLDASMRLRQLLPRRRPRAELAGFAFPPDVRASVARVNLTRIGRVDARRVLVFAAVANGDVSRLRDALTGTGSVVQINAPENGEASEAAMVRASARQAAVVAGTTVAEIATHIESAFA